VQRHADRPGADDQDVDIVDGGSVTAHDFLDLGHRLRCRGVDVAAVSVTRTSSSMRMPMPASAGGMPSAGRM
jgi:hypothetical protein